MTAQQTRESLLKTSTTRRAILGGSIAAASVAVTYAALGDKFGILDGLSSGSTRSDADALKKESVRINHLLRRAGFGVSREEYDHYQSLGLKATIDELVNYTSVDDSAAETLAGQIPLDRQGLPTRWLVRMANTKRPLQEKMTLFWHGLLTSQISVVQVPEMMERQNNFFRANAMATFPEILKGISMDPAMMIYLDISGSQRRAPNENYARELMELFALGIGNYTEQDIREAARAFTGWFVPRRRTGNNDFEYDEPTFRPNLFDGGTKTVLGRSGNFRPEDVIDIIVEQPASASFIVGKLFAFFAYPGADEQTLKPFVDTYLGSGKSIGATVEAILRSDEMYSPRAYRSIVRSPVEYAVAAIKALGLQGGVAGLVAQNRGQTLAQMGQVLYEPPNVAGWPGGETWLNSATMFARLNFINLVTGGAPQPAPRGARQQSQPAPGANLGTAAQALDYYLPLVLDDNVPEEARRVLLDYAGGPDAPLSPEQLRGLVYLILASPQFHLA
ncbi:MAG TPA: DUF1800 domain-containing protein [Dehalococcoidia bacterium]|nr:DUF1800 domain-containing protein [Dehalococcoidia bacterium]